MNDPMRRMGENDYDYQRRVQRARAEREAANRPSNLSQQLNDPLNPGNPLNTFINPPAETPRPEPSSPSTDTSSSSSSFSSTDNSGSSSFGE